MRARLRPRAGLATLLAFASLACIAATSAAAQHYPERLIKIVVPFAPGGPVDVMGRLVAQRMAPILRQSVIIENRVGGGGVIGAKAVATAEPDGYTLLFGNVSTLAVIPAVSKNRDYDPAKNFVPVAKVSDSPEVLVVASSFPARTVQELVAIARRSPGTLNFGSSGYGNATHLAGRMVQGEDRDRRRPHPLQGPLRGRDRRARRPGQIRVRRDRRGDAAHSGRPAARARRDQRAALRAAAGAAHDDRERGRRLRRLELPGRGGAGRHSAGDRRQAQCGDQRSRGPAGDAHPTARLGATPATGTPEEFAAFFATETRKWETVVKTAGVSLD